MHDELHEAVRQVLKEASEQANFFDYSDAERLNWMIQRGYELGKRVADLEDKSAAKSQERSVWRAKRQTSL